MNLSELKIKQRVFYDGLGTRYCEILEAEVHFTARGFHHLINKSNSNNHRSYPRNSKEQVLKLKCLEHAPEVIMKSRCIAETREGIRIVKGIEKSVKYYELKHTIKKGDNISVIIEQVGNGNYCFLSVKINGKRKVKSKNAPKDVL